MSSSAQLKGRVPKKTTKVWTYAELHKTGNHGIQDTRQIVDSKTNDIEKRWVQISHKTTYEKSNLTLINKPSTSSARHQWTHGH